MFDYIVRYFLRTATPAGRPRITAEYLGLLILSSALIAGVGWAVVDAINANQAVVECSGTPLKNLFCRIIANLEKIGVLILGAVAGLTVLCGAFCIAWVSWIPHPAALKRAIADGHVEVLKNPGGWVYLVYRQCPNPEEVRAAIRLFVRLEIAWCIAAGCGLAIGIKFLVDWLRTS